MSSSIKVKFLVDSEQKRVVFAEAGRDFVDALFSFLTLPLGSIVQLLSEKSGLGSLDNLYKSVEPLDAKCMQTDACKEMLLYPRSAATIQCENLKIRVIEIIQCMDSEFTVHERNPQSFYTCRQAGCLTKSTCYYSYTSKALCSLCGKLMVKDWLWPKETSDEAGVFINDAVEFMITDDLRVIPSSSKTGFLLLKEMQIEDGSVLQEMIIDFGRKEALDLLRRSLVSKTALTEMCFPDACVLAVPDYFSPIKEEIVVNEVEKLISLEIVLNKRNNSVVYAEAGEDFVNLMFSFLTFPLGSVFRILSDKPSLFGCIKKLYSSVEQMGLDCFTSETCRNMLINPKLSTFHGLKNQILELEEITSKKLIVQTGCCAYCYLYLGCKPNIHCTLKIKETEFIEQNPKSVKGVSDNGGAFVSGSRKYIVTDTLHISPLSFVSVMGNGMNFPISDLVRKEVFINKGKALSLLSAIMMGSKAVLTDVFFPKSMRRRINMQAL